ncbi:hypothetical protein CMI47_15615 [Candidatus Pacearchaeota archaeon]|nr:hypothetical protein [Candidatus Pacearchaeota archaeon]
MEFIPSKISTYFRVVGSPDQGSNAFKISEVQDAYIDALNCLSLEQGNYPVRFRSDADESTSIGCFQSYSFSENIQDTSLVYPIASNAIGKMYVYIRLRFSDVLKFNVKLDDVELRSVEILNQDPYVNIDNNMWMVYRIELVSHVRKVYNLSIIPESSGIQFDSLVISFEDHLYDETPIIDDLFLTDNELFSEAIINKNFQSPYLTILTKLFVTNNIGNIEEEFAYLGVKTTADDSFREGWSNFEITPLPGYQFDLSYSEYVFGVFVTPSSDSYYLVWDYSDDDPFIDPYSSSVSYKIINGEFVNQGDSNQLAIKVYSDRDPLDEEFCSIQTEPGKEYIKYIETFSDAIESDVSRNVKIIENDDGTESVELDLPDSIVSFIVDQSGSMTWNDSKGFRFDLIRDIAYRFNSGYPGNISYNLLTYQATPIITQFFGILEDEVEDTSNINEAEFSFFYDPVNGFAGVHVVRKEGSIPSNPLDGEIVASGFFDRLFDDGLDPSKTYYYSVYGRDLNQHFSRAETIEVQSRKRIVPYGIGDLTGMQRIGTGVRRDSYTEYLYHMDESSGDIVYDFGFSGINLLYTDDSGINSLPLWLDQGETPQASPDDPDGKGSGVRLNGQSQYLESKEKVIINDESFTVMGWVYPFADEDNDFYGDRCILSLQNEPTLIIDDPYSAPYYQSNTYLQIIHLSSGEVAFSFNGEDFVKTSGVLSPNMWNQFSVSLDGSKLNFYINGEHDSEYDLPDSFVRNIIASTLYIGRDRTEKYNGFFGKVTEFSFHSIKRDVEYIYNNYLYLTKDNGDRIFTLQFTYPYRDDDDRDVRVKIVRNSQIGSLKYLSDTLAGPDNYGFGASGNSRAVYGSDIGPTHENDGDIVFDEIVTDSLNEITIIEDFASPLSDSQTSLGSQRGFEIYYRAFSQNQIGNWSIPSDSSLVSFSPSILEQEDRPDATLPAVTYIESIPGNQKVYLRWTMPQDDNVTHVLVYYSPEDTISIDPYGNPHNSWCVFIGDADSGEFVHRAGRLASEVNSGPLGTPAVQTGDLTNDKTAYYMVVTRDRFGNLSEPVFINEIPKENTDESIIPVESVLGVQKQPVDENAISLKWYNPIRAETFGGLTLSGGEIEGYLTDRVVLYARITDLFGRPFSESFKVEIKNERGFDSYGDPTSGVVSMKSELYNPYTGEIIEPIDWDQLISKTTHITKDGWVRVFIQPSKVPISVLSYIASAGTDIWLEYFTKEKYYGDSVSGNPFGFLYKSREIALDLVNPFEFSIVANTYVEHDCSPFDDYYGNFEYLKGSTGPEICNYDLFGDPCTGDFLGSYVKRNEPYRITCECSYEGKPLADGSQVYIEVRDDVAPFCNALEQPMTCEKKEDWYFDPATKRMVYSPTFDDVASDVVSPLRPVYDFVQSGDDGSVAYLDVAVPEYARTVRAIIYASVNGFTAMSTVYLLFEPNLKIEIEGRAPVADGVDIAQQQASVYFVDPDTGVKTPMEDLTVVKWELLRLRNTIRNRPFYTTSEVQGNRYADGIYDYQIDGVSDNIYFGPADNVEWKLVEDIEWVVDPITGDDRQIAIIRKIPEEYILRATVNYNGVLAQAVHPLCIIPFGPPDVEDPLEPVTHFLIEPTGETLDQHFVQEIWSDGIDFAGFDIVRDPSLGDTDVQSKFAECHSGNSHLSGCENWFLTTLPENKPIDIRMGEYPRKMGEEELFWQYHIDIVHGDSFTFEEDEFGFEFLLSNYVEFNRATMQTGEENTKRFYVRSNGFISKDTADPLKRAFYAACPHCFHCKPMEPWDLPIYYHMSIDGFTSIIHEGREFPVMAMGSWGKGIPPKLIRFKEPLKLEFSHIEVNGELSNDFIIDGVSYNDLIFKISFSNKRVPDGERCTVYSCGTNPLQVESEFVYVENFSSSNSPYSEPLYWSYVKVRVYPIGPEKKRDGIIFVESNYDKLGTVYRQKVCGAKINYEPVLLPPVVYDEIQQDLPMSRPSNQTPFLRSCWSYNTLLGGTQAEEDSAWTQIPSMNIRRGMSEAEYVNGRIYTFGGVTTFGITNQSESWAQGDDSWTSEMSMPQPLFGYNSVNDGRYIYIIGGVGLDSNDRLQVQNSLYRFDTVTGVWDQLADIPPVESEFVDQPTGACCVTGEDCFISTYWECEDAGGIFMGEESTCEEETCESGDFGGWIGPDFDPARFGLRYGCAFGNAHIIDGKIHLMCGINLVDSDRFEPIRYNNFIYVYDIGLNKWFISSKIIDDDSVFYNRINAFSFYEERTDSIHVVSGQGYRINDNGDINADETFTFTDSFRYDIFSSYLVDEYSSDPDYGEDPYSSGDSEIIIESAFVPIIRTDDNSYINIPTPKYRGKATTIESEYYLFGGFIEESDDSPGTVASRKIELVTFDQTTGLFDTDKTLPKSLSGRSYHGLTSDSNNVIYVIGGLGTGHAPGYVQIEANAYSGDNVLENADPPPCPENMLHEACEEYQENWLPISSLRLDGESGATIRIRVFDDEGDLIKKQLTCVVTGYLIFTAELLYGQQLMGLGGRIGSSEADRSTLLYPVIFSENEFKINNGVSSTRLMPRSEDPLKPIDELKEVLGIDERHQFDVGSFPYDEIMEVIQGELRSPYEIEVRIKIVDDFYYGSTVDRGEDDLYGGEGSDGVVYFPENDQIDLIASENDWDNAELISDFQLRNVGRANVGIAYTSSKIAIIAPKYDTDLFYFNTWDAGDYYFTINRVGFSMLKAILSVYNDDHEKVSELIYSDDDFLRGVNSHKISLNANSKYFLLVRALEEEGDPQLDADFGQYRLRVSRLAEMPDPPPPPIDTEVVCPFICPVVGGSINIVRCYSLGTSASLVDINDVDDDIIDVYSEGIIDEYGPYYDPDDNNSEVIPNTVLVEPLDFTLLNIDDDLIGGGSMGGGGIPDTPSPRIAFYADFEWLPEVKNILFNNTSSYDDLVKHLEKLKYTVPFGSSPMLDSIMELSTLLSSADDKKTIYMLTDNSDNTSSININDALEYLSGIDGEGNTPVVIGNLSNVYPITLSALASRTDTEGIDIISRKTRGRSFTILSEEFLDDFVDLSVARGAGSVGFGEFYYVFDLKQLSMVNSMSVSFFIPENSDANWSFATSVDGINYTEFSREFNHNETADFDDLTCRYIKWNVQFIHLLKPSDDGSVDSPSLSSFNLAISADKESFIFMNKEVDSSSVQQLIATTLSSVPDNSSLEIGVGSGESSDWSDFYSKSQDSVNEDGKVFVPIRSTMSDDDNPEPLISIDDLVFEPFYGPWDVNSDFTIVDSETGQVDKDLYRVYPRRGIVVFSSYQRNRSFNIFIDPPPTFRVAVKVTNKKPESQVSLDGVAYQYNTNIFLPSQYTNRPPIAYDLKVSPEYPAIYSPVNASYRYADLNGDPENKDKTEIKWYINGVEQPWLKNLTKFNDLDNPEDIFYSNVGTFSLTDVLQFVALEGLIGDTPEQTAALRGESIFKVGDQVYFTVKPHDGFQYGDVAYSNVITVVETPPFLTRLEIKGRRISNLSPTERYTTGAHLFADFDYFSPVEQNNSIIRWFVNDDIFKEGLLNEANDSGILNTLLTPGEFSAATGVAVHSFDIGNIIYCEITPVGSSSQGDTVQSQTVTIENEIPSISNVEINGRRESEGNGTANLNDNLSITYDYHDTDLEFNFGQLIQSDRTVVQWLVSSGDSSFVEYELPAGSDPKILYASNTVSGQDWKARITPFDGISQGESVETVEIHIL